MRIVRACTLAAIAVVIGGCSSSPTVPGAIPAGNTVRLPAAGATKIQHVVILIQENRSFDNFFATFPGAEGTNEGKLHNGTSVPLVKAGLLTRTDVPHGYRNYRIDYDGGKMDGFDVVATEFGFSPTAPYQYVDPKQISVYWTLAKRYVLADHMFMTEGSDSFTAHQDLIAGDTQIDANDVEVDGASANGAKNHPGCDAAIGTVTSLVTRDDLFRLNAGPFPCFTYATLRDLLDRKHVSWRYYHSTPYDQWNPFEAIRAVRYSAEWGTKVVDPQTRLFGDIENNRLPAVSWVIPTGQYSDHPGIPQDYGPDWVGSVVNAIGESPYWNSTAIFVVWDDWGGFYDHVAPQQFGFGQLGFRVPAIIVSPYARSGYVAHTRYEFGSMLRFIEDNWQLGRLGTSDVRAHPMDGVFDFTQPPRPYVPVRVAHPPSFFISLPPSNVPLDTE